MDEGGAEQVAYQLTARRFESLEADFRRWCAGGERRRDGLWMLVAFERGVRQAFRHSERLATAAVAAWRAEQPDSSAARLAEAIGIIHPFPVSTEFGDRSGNEAANAVSRTAGQRAWDLLRPAQGSRQAACPAVDAVALQALFLMHADRKVVGRTYRQAANRTPTYVPLHLGMAAHVWRWSSTSPGDYEAFVLVADDRMARAGEGGLYSWIHGPRRLQMLAQAERTMPPSHQSQIRAMTSKHWSRLAASYEARARRWTDSYTIRNDFAGAACLAGDGNRYRALRDELLPYRRWLSFPEAVDICDLRHGYLPPEQRPGAAGQGAQNPSDDAPGKAPVKPWTSDRHQRLRG